jgi:hypothetical protein
VKELDTLRRNGAARAVEANGLLPR